MKSFKIFFSTRQVELISREFKKFDKSEQNSFSSGSEQKMVLFFVRF